jgi:hypothetical protein
LRLSSLAAAAKRAKGRCDIATHTLATANNLIAVTFSQSPLVLLPADLATCNNAILDDLNVAHPRIPGSFTYEGGLFIPNRGRLKVLPGDKVAYDNRGWPILISADSIANGTTWTFT